MSYHPLYQKQWRQDNPDKVKQQKARRRARLKQKTGTSGVAPYDQWRWKLKRDYGITAEQYEHLWTTQSGLCAICHQPESKVQFGKPRRLSVDHCHTTHRVRGLLCYRCNVALGWFGDSVSVLTQAIAYLA